MSLPSDSFVYGLTGAFGSGCTTLATALREELDFSTVKISELILAEWRRRQQTAGEGGGLDQPPRGTLQDIGDELRKSQGVDYWAKQAIKYIEEHHKLPKGVVIDGIRNPGEAEWLRQHFNHFYLIAVDTHPNKRWERLQKLEVWRGQTRADFDAINARDKEAPEDWGQRVQQCMDQADYVIVNDEDEVLAAAYDRLLESARDLLQLSREPPSRRPTDDEYFMQLAYAASSGSACIKRNVGAVIVRPEADRLVATSSTTSRQPGIVAVGFNENPDWMQPCYLEYKACFKDQWIVATWRASKIAKCPYCGADLGKLPWPYRCPNSKCERRNLMDVFFPERAMTKCTAIHAENRAILNAGADDLTGCRIYSTTFPCFLCAEQILQAGITSVVYVEAYPDSDGERLFEKHGVALHRFQGVKSRAFNRLFGTWRADAEAKTSAKIELLSKEVS